VDACQVSVAAGSRDEAERIAQVLLDARLSACVQLVGPVESRYWWQGSREAATEWLCLVKTRTSLVDRVVAAVRAAHSYDVPEVVAVPIVGGDPEYLRWLEAEASGGGEA
jgi:periplasmic divalent cation tolerance protein